MLGSGAVRVLAAVLDLTARGERPTLATVAVRSGRSKTTAYHHLLALRRHGLVSWADGTRGTLRPTCRPVAARLAADG